MLARTAFSALLFAAGTLGQAPSNIISRIPTGALSVTGLASIPAGETPLYTGTVPLSAAPTDSLASSATGTKSMTTTMAASSASAASASASKTSSASGLKGALADEAVVNWVVGVLVLGLVL